MKTILVTGGCGFIGSNFVLKCRNQNLARIINLDALTYAGNPQNLQSLSHDPLYIFVHGNITDSELVRKVFEEYQPDAVVNFAAESHVDRSILGPEAFITTNIVGTFHLLNQSLAFWKKTEGEKNTFRFLHISTDEVYGSLKPDDPPFKETTPYAPNSPYAASKASSDHLVRAYSHTYGLPVIVTNCSNNYGPRQFPEKLIPLMILNAKEGKPLPVYGDGKNVRDWLHVEDHCEALVQVLKKAKPGETFNIGGDCEIANIDMVHKICAIMDELFPGATHLPHSSLITFVKDRPGHDWRYAMDCSKLKRQIGWNPRVPMDKGLRSTIEWYLENPDWVSSIRTGEYKNWLDVNYNQR